MTAAPTLWTDPSGVDHEVSPRQLFRLAVTNDGSAPCWLARFSAEKCDGVRDAAHLLRAQKVKQHFPLGAWRWPGGKLIPTTRGDELHDALEVFTLDELMYDPRLGVPACRRHHDLLDRARTLKVPRAELPDAVEEAARDLELVWWIDLEYPGAA